MDKYLAQLYDTMEGLSNNQLRYSNEAYQPKDFLEHIELFEQWSDSSSIINLNKPLIYISGL